MYQNYEAFSLEREEIKQTIVLELSHLTPLC